MSVLLISRGKLVPFASYNALRQDAHTFTLCWVAQLQFSCKEVLPSLKYDDLPESYKEAFYQRAKVPHSIYSSVNVHELFMHVLGYYRSIIGSLRYCITVLYVLYYS